jgi:hypothetical protein
LLDPVHGLLTISFGFDIDEYALTKLPAYGEVWQVGDGGLHLWLIHQLFHLFHETPETPDVGHDGLKAVLKETL